MSRSVLFWICLLIVLTMLAGWTIGCRNDINVPFPPSLVGDYTGIYSFVEVGVLGDTVYDTSQVITFRFTQSSYEMVKDTSIAESLRVFCDNLGEYELRDGVTMGCEGNDCNFTRGVCTEEWNPNGYFGLDQTSDTMRLLQDQTDSLGVRQRKLIRLVLVTD